MKKKQVHFIEDQQTRVRNIHENDSLSSSYTNWHERGNAEPPSANPDALEDCDANKLWGRGSKPELAELIIEKFADENGYFPILTKKQNEVLRLYLLGMNSRAIAIELKRNYGNIDKSLREIQRRFKRLLKAVDL